MKFKAEVLLAGKTATGIVVPEKVVESFGSGKKPPVTITINGYTYRNTIAVMGGEYMVGISAEHRKGANINAGDEIEVIMELDTQPRIAEVPIDFQAALDQAPKANIFFDTLSYSRKQGLILPIKDAKTQETRQKRIEKAISMLLENKA